MLTAIRIAAHLDGSAALPRSGKANGPAHTNTLTLFSMSSCILLFIVLPLSSISASPLLSSSALLSLMQCVFLALLLNLALALALCLALPLASVFCCSLGLWLGLELWSLLWLRLWCWCWLWCWLRRRRRLWLWFWLVYLCAAMLVCSAVLQSTLQP